MLNRQTTSRFVIVIILTLIVAVFGSIAAAAAGGVSPSSQFIYAMSQIFTETELTSAPTPTPAPCGNTLDYPTFDSIAGIRLNGTAAQSGNVLRLTEAITYQTSTAWVIDKQVVQYGFETSFDFVIPFSGFAGDGFTFALQNSASGPLAIGGPASCGSCLGYAGVANSLAVEFDVYHSQLRVATNGSTAPIASVAYSGLNNSAIHQAVIHYVPGVLTVFVDDLITPKLVTPVDIATLGLDNGQAHVGFTAATGLAYEIHDILDWSFTSQCATYPTLGNYADTSVALSGNATIMPNGAPTDTTSISVSAPTSFYW